MRSGTDERRRRASDSDSGSDPFFVDCLGSRGLASARLSFMHPPARKATMSLTPSQLRRLAASRPLEHVVVLGANGTMGYGSAALFTQAVERVTLLARTRDKAAEGLAAAIKQVRSPTVANRAEVGSYEDLDAKLASADLVFEALTEDFALKKQMFDRVEKARRADSIVATVTSGLSINELAEGRSE